MPTTRNHALDALRGLAIACMIVDHVAEMVFGIGYVGWNGRAIGRLAEPLFALLLGYFLVGRTRPDVLRRGRQVLLAEIVLAPLLYGLFGRADILGAFLIIYALTWLLGGFTVWLLPSMFLGRWDPTQNLLDYPLFVVASQVACGMLLRRRWGWLAAGVVAVAGVLEPNDLFYAGVLVPLGAGLIWLAERHPTVTWWPLEAMGRRPLVWYTVHIAIVAAIGFAVGRLGGPDWVERMFRSHYSHVPLDWLHRLTS